MCLLKAASEGAIILEIREGRAATRVLVDDRYAFAQRALALMTRIAKATTSADVLTQ